jgi:hypothetical protein
MATASQPAPDQPLDRREPGAAPVAAAAASDGAHMRFARHAQLLARWPILDERWARSIEARRIEAANDRTPGPATFGR